MRHRLLALVCVAASLLTACGALPEGGTERRTVTVWLMKDSASKEFLKRFTEDFERTHGDLRLDIRIQEWTGIGEKVQAALKREDKGAPDVIEVGNTQVAQYVDGGGLSDLTLESMRDWGMNDWLPGLAEPGRFNTRQFGIPWYAANRVVIYRKDLFARAGIKHPRRPATSGSQTPNSSTPPGTKGFISRARTGTRSPDSSGTRAATSRRRPPPGPGRAPCRRRPRCGAWTSTGGCRHSARDP